MQGTDIYARARQITETQLAHLRRHRLTGVVVEELEAYPDFQPSGSSLHFEKAATEAGTFFHYVSLTINNKLTFLVVLSDRPELTDADAEEIAENWFEEQVRRYGRMP